MLREVHKVFRKWLGPHIMEPLDVILASIISLRLRSDPIWLLLLGPSGRGKTELLLSVINQPPVTLYMETVTSKTLYSGQKGKDASFAHEIIGKVWIMKELSAMLGRDPRERAHVMSQLRSMYDGIHAERFGTGETRGTKGRFGILAGVVPAIEADWITHVALGERFLFYRMLPHGEDDRISGAYDGAGTEREMRQELHEAVKPLLLHFWAQNMLLLKRTIDTASPKETLMALAQVIAKWRSDVAIDKWTRELQYVPEAEEGNRLVKVFKTFGIAHALLYGKTEMDLKLIRKIALNSMGSVRGRVMQGIMKGEGLSLEDLSKKCRLGKATVDTHLKCVNLLGLVKEKDNRWWLKTWMRDKMMKAGLI